MTIKIAELIRSLIDTGKVQDANQIAFLFPSVKNNVQVSNMKAALEKAEAALNVASTHYFTSSAV